MNLAAVRQALADALDFPELNVVNPYAAWQPQPPGIQIIPPGVVYDYTFQAGTAGLDTWTFIVQGFVALTDDIASQQLLDELCSPNGTNSVKGKLEADRTLGGLVATLQVSEQSAGRAVDRGGSGPMLLVEWRVMIYGNAA